MESFSPAISITFILTTFLCVGILFRAIKRSVLHTLGAKIVVFAIGFWLIFTTILARAGFFLDATGVPPRIALFGIIPAFAFITFLFIAFRSSFIEKLPLRTLTILHIVRIPVEVVLLWLFQSNFVPRSMTFEGNNFDILAGISAPIVYIVAFRAKKVSRPILIVWNVIALGLLANVVVTALLSFPSPMQQLAFDQPNTAIMYFPLIWLPTLVVPIVLFCHLASLFKLLTAKTS